VSDVISSSPPVSGVSDPPPISTREIWPWALFGLVLLALAYMVGVGEGTALMSESTLHELLHDGRHLLAFPCH
jgi:hypothetical protein